MVYSDIPFAGGMNESETPQCPECSKAGGRACSVSVGQGYREITYKCSKCGHTWTVTFKEPELQPNWN